MLSVDYTSEDEEYEYVVEIEVKEQVNACKLPVVTLIEFSSLQLSMESRKSLS